MDVTIASSVFTTAHYDQINTTIEEMVSGKQDNKSYTPTAGSTYDKAKGGVEDVWVHLQDLKRVRHVIALAQDPNVSEVIMEDHDYIKLTVILSL